MLDRILQSNDEVSEELEEIAREELRRDWLGFCLCRVLPTAEGIRRRRVNEFWAKAQFELLCMMSKIKFSIKFIYAKLYNLI